MYKPVKRFLDIILCLFAVVALSPVYLLTALGIELSSPGTILYHSMRAGIHKKPFKFYKFRSMHVNSEADTLQATKDDPRKFPFGNFIRKTNIDEFPQFFNVLKGEMSLVGTRPPTMDEWERYDMEHRVRMSIKPGITGLWQASGRSDTDYARRVALDVHYVLNWSPWMDIWILFRTVYAVVFMRGAR